MFCGTDSYFFFERKDEEDAEAHLHVLYRGTFNYVASIAGLVAMPYFLCGYPAINVAKDGFTLGINESGEVMLDANDSQRLKLNNDKLLCFDEQSYPKQKQHATRNPAAEKDSDSNEKKAPHPSNDEAAATLDATAAHMPPADDNNESNIKQPPQPSEPAAYNAIAPRKINIKDCETHQPNKTWESGAELGAGMRTCTPKLCANVLALFCHLGATELNTQEEPVIVPRFPCQPNLNTRKLDKERNMFTAPQTKESTVATYNNGVFFTAAGCTETEYLNVHAVHAQLYSARLNSGQVRNPRQSYDAFTLLHAPQYQHGKLPSNFQQLCKLEPAIPVGEAENNKLLVDAYAAEPTPEEVHELYQRLLGKKFPHTIHESCQSEWDKLPPSHQAMILFGELIQDFQVEYNCFQSKQDWWNFFCHHKRYHPLSSVPQDFPDLCFRVFVIMNALSSLRLAYTEGLCRVSSTLHSLVRKEPPVTTQKLMDNMQNSVYMSNLVPPPNLKAVSSPQLNTFFYSFHGIGGGSFPVAINEDGTSKQTLFLTNLQAEKIRDSSSHIQSAASKLDRITIPQALNTFLDSQHLLNSDSSCLSETAPADITDNATNQKFLEKWLSSNMDWIVKHTDLEGLHELLVEAMKDLLGTKYTDSPSDFKGLSYKDLIESGRDPELLQPVFQRFFKLFFKTGMWKKSWDNKPAPKALATYLSFVTYPFVDLPAKKTATTLLWKKLMRVFSGALKCSPDKSNFLIPNGKHSYGGEWCADEGTENDVSHFCAVIIAYVRGQVLL